MLGVERAESQDPLEDRQDVSDKAGLILGEHHDTVDVIHDPSLSREDQCASEAPAPAPAARLDGERRERDEIGAGVRGRDR